MWPLIIGGGMSLYGQYQQNQALNDMQGPDLDKINEQLMPWETKVEGLMSRADTLTGKGYDLSTQGYDLRDKGYGMADIGSEYLDESKDMFDPSGQYQTSQTNLLRENLTDSSKTSANDAMTMYAKQGFGGGGGMNTLMQSVMNNKALESLRLGSADIQQSGFQRGMMMRELGIGTMGKGYGIAQSGLGMAGTGLGLASQGVGQYGQGTQQFGQIAENRIRADEAAREFENQKIQQQAANNPWSQIGNSLMSYGMGSMSQNPGTGGATPTPTTTPPMDFSNNPYTTSGGGGFDHLQRTYSDIALKENIVKVGNLSDGLPVYEFNYHWDNNKMTGVMAQDVEKIYPDAVTTDKDGYKMVNYSLIKERNK